MTARFVLLLLTTAFCCELAAQPTPTPAIGAAQIEALGEVNGQALACRSFSTSKTAKALMTRYAPKTRLYGALFESATNAAFTEQTKTAQDCPSELSLGDRLFALESELRQVFPPDAEPLATTGAR
jgi:hypothetical protein